MTAESGTFRVGQEVEVTSRARVAEVSTGSAGHAPPILRLEPLDGSYNSPPGGWVDPQAVTVSVTREPLPSKPGIYWCNDTDQSSMTQWHTDGRQFHYLNTEGNWVDVGWGQPTVNDMPLNGPLVETPF